MPYFTDGVVPWNSLDDNTRAPLASELESGYPCGPADQELFNWTAGWPIGNIWNMILLNGITPDADKLLDLARAQQAGKVAYAVAGGTANALTATLSPVPASLTVGMAIKVKISTTNTGPATLNVNGIGAISLTRLDGSDVKSGDLLAGAIMEMIYTGTAWLSILNGGANAPAATMQAYATPGTFSFTVPAGVFRIRARTWGGGGGGGGTSNINGCGAGGGGGGYAEGIYSVTPGQILSIIVGARGAAGGNFSAGGAGGTSSVGSLISANGGGAGGPSPQPSGNGVGLSPGAGGTGSGMVNITGQSGGTGYPISASNFVAGAGGGAFGTTTSGQPAGTGGISGLTPGGGGSGSAANALGGQGGSGLVIIEY